MRLQVARGQKYLTANGFSACLGGGCFRVDKSCRSTKGLLEGTIEVTSIFAIFTFMIINIFC
jgi:hypothetical protein